MRKDCNGNFYLIGLFIVFNSADFSVIPFLHFVLSTYAKLSL